MKKVKFLFGVHCHQPVGNFEHVMVESYERSYLPFIQAMARYPKIKFAVHYSGILYDWFMAKHPEFIELLQQLVKRGQMEVFTAGYYEPILPILNDADKLGQIEMSNQFIKTQFKTVPQGLWLTERIWEPSLPKVLASAGIEYVTVDDYHFISAGVSEDQLLGYYVTEEQGSLLKVFPINKNLRYQIPFKLPEETIKYLKDIAAEGSPPAAVLFDDGEKFGVWPGTHKWVYEDGYLEDLLNNLEANSSWIEFMTFSEYVDACPPVGRIYLPTASYFEMMEWSLLTSAGKKMEKVTEELKANGKFDEYSQFFKGGLFRNFFVKYPESNNMHKKMLYVSHKLQMVQKGKSAFGAKESAAWLEDAVAELYKGQCNCAYWHGVFGGLYLNYLRHAVYEHLIKAEIEIDKFAHGKKDFVDLTVTDFNKDGIDEVLISNSLLFLGLAPGSGGALFELDYKPKAFNLTNTLARREEVYHQKIREGVTGQNSAVASIHDAVTVKEAGLEKALVYDWHARYCLLDHFLAEDTDLARFAASSYREQGDFTLEPYGFSPHKRMGSEVSITLARDGKVDGVPVKVEKTLSLFAKQSIINIDYQVSNRGKEQRDFWFGSEFNLSLLAGNAPDRYYVIPEVVLEDKSMQSWGALQAVGTVKLVDEWSGFTLSLDLSVPALLWRFPIETVSQSEGGFEKTYQGSVIFPSWKFSLKPGETWKVRLVLKVEE